MKLNEKLQEHLENHPDRQRPSTSIQLHNSKAETETYPLPKVITNHPAVSRYPWIIFVACTVTDECPFHFVLGFDNKPDTLTIKEQQELYEHISTEHGITNKEREIHFNRTPENMFQAKK